MQGSFLARCSVYVRLAHDFRTPVGFAVPPRRVNDHAFLYIREGTGWFAIHERRLALAPGSLMIVRPDVLHALGTDSGVAFHMLNLHCDLVETSASPRVAYPKKLEDDPRSLPEDEGLPGRPSHPEHLPPLLTLSRPQLYEHLFHQIHALRLNADPVGVLRRKAFAANLLACIFEEARGLIGHTEDERIDRILAYLRSNLHKPVKLAGLAEMAYLSRNQFARRFRLRLGCSPMEYLLRLRMEQAKLLLSYGDLPIKELAHCCGFASVHHFTRRFSAVVGLPPARYRLVTTAAGV